MSNMVGRGMNSKNTLLRIACENFGILILLRSKKQNTTVTMLAMLLESIQKLPGDMV